jgi:hypothetical protein
VRGAAFIGAAFFGAAFSGAAVRGAAFVVVLVEREELVERRRRPGTEFSWEVDGLTRSTLGAATDDPRERHHRAAPGDGGCGRFPG